MSSISGMQPKRVENKAFGFSHHTIGVGYNKHRADFSALSSLPRNFNGQIHHTFQGYEIEAFSPLTDFGDDILFSGFRHLS
jgi:hypothetical protein